MMSATTGSSVMSSATIGVSVPSIDTTSSSMPCGSVMGSTTPASVMSSSTPDLYDERPYNDTIGGALMSSGTTSLSTMMRALMSGTTEPVC